MTPPLHEGPLQRGNTQLLRLDDANHIRELARQGLGIKAICRATGYSENTVKKYLRGAPAPPQKRTRNKPRILDPYRDFIRSRLAQWPGLAARRLYEDLQQIGYAGKETQVKRFVREIRGDRAIRAVWRFETPPGEQAQVDWAHVGYVMADGQRRKAYAFVMVLGYSRVRFVAFTTDMHTATFIRLHLEAFAYFGGFPKTLLYDNLQNVVLERGPDPDHRQWNSLFRDFFQSLGFRPHLCAPYRAQTKGKVEASIKFLRNGFLVGRTFSSLEEMNLEVQPWLRKINFERPHDTTGRIPAELLAEEKLTALDPSRPYVITERYPRKVRREWMVSFQANEYSVPWIHAGREAMVSLTGKMLTIEVAGEVVARHELRNGTRHRVRLKEHRDGLQEAIRSKNRQTEEWRTARYAFEAVAQRPLDEYEQLAREVRT